MAVEVKLGNGGFVELRDDVTGERLVARLMPDERGRWALREVWFSAGGHAFSPARLRDLPLARLENLANGEWRDYFNERVHVLAPRFEDVADKIGTTFGSQATAKERASLKPPPAPRKRRRRAPLRAPARVDEPFLHELAVAYRDCVAKGVPPAPTIAAEAGVSERTVHAWIRKARDPRFGALPPGRRGAAG